MGDAAKGILALVGAGTIWGLSPLFYALLGHVPALEILSYRCLWSLAVFAGLLAVQGRLGLVWQSIASPSGAGLTLVAGLLIAANWFGFIFAIQAGRTTEASLGYYIFPLVAVLIGRVILGERLGRAQWLAVTLAALAVLILTVRLDTPPVIALFLATIFGIYGMLKKRLAVGPVVSVTGEVALLAVPFALWLLWQGTPGLDLRTHLLLFVSGPLTATPLILFSYAARRVRLSTLGLVQYLNPTLQFVCAVVVFREPFTTAHQVAFVLIWVGLAIYSAESLRQDRAARRAASSAATSATRST